MQTLSEIRALLAGRDLRPKHRLGQNFLHDQNQLRRLINAAHLSRGDVVLEVGPGTGTLTEALLE
ncbi:MAG TPA: rRNA adenine N-6-methyltransferase family protein, partial [Phycisphaerales bacterium]|nr:rRNA adenine N-6-methyltransferase family protein [Phycisphaerales bacterium]